MHKNNMQDVRKGMEKQNKVRVIEKVLRAGGASVHDKTGQAKQYNTIFQKAQLPQKWWPF